MTPVRSPARRTPVVPASRTTAFLALAFLVLVALVLLGGLFGSPPAGAAPRPVAQAVTSPGPAVPGTLHQPSSPRRYGLPVALALVAALGSGSLLVRTLLAEPRRW